MLITTVLCGVVAALLLGAGIRGRRLDTHPHCRRCGYDLHRADEDRKACPECGATLGSSRAIRVGTRRRRPRLIGAGAALLALALGLGGVTLLGSADRNDIKPVWLLAWEMSNRAGVERDAAFDELYERFAKGTMSAAQHRRFAGACLTALHDLDRTWRPEWTKVIATSDLSFGDGAGTAATIDAVLRIQADADAAWRAGLGDRVEWLREVGLVADDLWATYLRQAVAPAAAFSVTDRIRPESTLRIGYERGPLRLGTTLTDPFGGTTEGPKLGVRVTVESPLVDGEPVKRVGRGRSVMHWSLNTARESGASGHGHALPPGRYVLDLPVEFTVTSTTRRLDRSRGTRGVWVADTVTDVTSWSKTYRLPVEVVDESVRLVTLAADPARAAQVRAALSCRVRRSDENPDRAGAAPTRTIDVEIDDPPLDVAFDVFLRRGDREVRIGSASAKACTSCSSHTTMHWPEAAWLDGLDRADAVFRPSTSNAEERGMTSIWSEEVVVPDVGLKRLAFRDAPPAEQVERLGESFGITWITGELGGPPVGPPRRRYSFVLYLDAPVALHHRVVCRVGSRSMPVGTVSAALGDRAVLSGEFDVEAGAEPPGTIEFEFTPADAAEPGAPADAWPGPFTIPSEVPTDEG